MEGSGFALPPELQLKPCEELPYESLEVLINAENVWANIQAYNVTSLGFDLTDETRWHPFIVPKVYDPPPPRPFYSTSKVAAKLPEQRLAALTATLGTKLRAEYTSWRLTRSMRMRFNSKVQSVLEEGLALLEQARCSSSSTAQMEVDKWRGRLMAATPPDHHFRGRALRMPHRVGRLSRGRWLMTVTHAHSPDPGERVCFFATLVDWGWGSEYSCAVCFE